MMPKAFLVTCFLLARFGVAQSQQPSKGAEPAQQQPTSEQRGTEQAPFVIRIQPPPEQTQIKSDTSAEHAPESRNNGWFSRWGLGDKLALLNGIVAFFQFC